MGSQAPRRSLQNSSLTLVPLWGGMIAAAILTMGYFVSRPVPELRPALETSFFLQIFLAIGVVQGLLGFLLPALIARATIKNLPELSEPDVDATKLADACLRPYILRLAMFDAMVILGGLGTMLTGNKLVVAGLGGAGVLLLLASFPSRTFQQKLLGLKSQASSLSRRLSK